MIETDYANAQILVKRGDEVKHTFKFKEFVSAKDFKPVNDLRNQLSAIERGDVKVDDKDAGKLDIKFYDLVTKTAFTNPISYTKAIDLLSVPEIGMLAEQVLVFLINWSSTEAVKQFGKQLAETQKNDTQPTADTQK